MKKLLLILAVLAFAIAWNTHSGSAQDKPRRLNERYEFAIVKWDGPDRLFYNLPDKFDLVHLGKSGVKIPGDAQAEEWCLAYAANQMAAEGWETITLDSRRIVLRRLK